MAWLVGREQEPAFYSLLLQQTEEILPIVYTPTVGQACQEYHRLPTTPVGLHLRATDASFLDRLRAWPHQNVRCCAYSQSKLSRLQRNPTHVGHGAASNPGPNFCCSLPNACNQLLWHAQQ